jgi:hypothetical protein
MELKNNKGAAKAAPRKTSTLRASYQGTTLRSPFFFLLLDSFCPFELFCDPSAGLAVASVVPSAGAAASVFASPLPVPAGFVAVFGGG